MLTYPEPAAAIRHPGQLLYGGFSKEVATLLLGGFGLLFLAGMGLWMLVLPHLRRTTVMFIGLGGLSLSIAGLTLINGLAENPARLLLVRNHCSCFSSGDGDLSHWAACFTYA